MNRTPIIYVSLLCLSWGVYAQGAPDLFSLTFTPGPISDDVLSAPPAIDEIRPPVNQTSEDGSRDPLFDTVQEITESIIEEESLNGERSSNLIGELTSLAAAYQELGDHFLAIAALERARQIIRINDGLHSLNQVEIAEQMIDTMEAAGAFVESDTLQDSLLELTAQNQGDPRVPSILAAAADRQMDAVNDYLEEGIWPRTREPLQAAEGSGWEPSTPKVGRHRAGPRLAAIRNSYDAAIHEALTNDDYEIGDSLGPQAELGATYYLIDTVNDFVEVGYLPRLGNAAGEWQLEIPENDREWALSALRRARRLYSTAMQAAYRDGSYGSGEYLGLEEQLLESYYFEMAHPELHSPRMHRKDLKGMIYLTGASVLQAKVINRLQSASAVDVAMALIELADLHLLFSRNGTALETYQQAYDLLVKQDVRVETIADLFSPEVPVILPAFASDAMDFNPERHYWGYIDVSIKIGRYGNSTGRDILNASSGTSGAIKRRLKGHVAESRFRPRFVDGQATRSDQFSLRYYFDY